MAYTPLPMGYPTEIFPHSLPSKGIAVGLSVMYDSLVIQAFVNPIGMDNISWQYHIVFCCFLAVFLVVTYSLFPETNANGHSLQWPNLPVQCHS
ncbi:hypothetical protein F4779DRAFT_584080 [Xylariaceae sp. FL0662B]|nr:hypothetical protein F4779DRAFT_584080 [Xylariaceae sp. FL0662B]